MSQGVTELRGHHPPWQDLDINKQNTPHLSMRMNELLSLNSCPERVWGFSPLDSSQPRWARSVSPAPGPSQLCPSRDSVNWWDVTARIPTGNWGCGVQMELPARAPTLPIPLEEPGAVPGGQGSPIPCPHDFSGQVLDRIRTCGSTGSWPGPWSHGRAQPGCHHRHPTQPQKAPFANPGISNQKKTPKKAFCQSSPWAIPVD